MKKLSIALVVSALSLIASASIAAPACPAFDIAGYWNNGHGEFFSITQDGCKSATVTDLRKHTQWIVPMDGQVAKVPESTIVKGGLDGEAASAVRAMRINGLLSGPEAGHELTATVNGAITLGNISDGTMPHQLCYSYTARITADSMESVAGGVNRVTELYLNTQDLRLTCVDKITVQGGATGAFLQGANFVLSYVRDSINAQLYRTNRSKIKLN